MIDSGCQVSLAKTLELPSYYWQETKDSGSAIEGTSVTLTAKAELFPVQFGKIKGCVTLYRLDSISEDCILGSEFLHKVSPYLVDHKKMKFTCILNGRSVTLPISFQGSRKCPVVVQKSVYKSNTAQLAKMDRS